MFTRLVTRVTLNDALICVVAVAADVAVALIVVLMWHFVAGCC